MTFDVLPLKSIAANFYHALIIFFFLPISALHLGLLPQSIFDTMDSSSESCSFSKLEYDVIVIKEHMQHAS